MTNFKMIYEGRVYESGEDEKSDIEEAKDIMYKHINEFNNFKFDWDYCDW